MDLGIRYGFSDERLAAMLYLDRAEVVRRREETLATLARGVGLDAETDRARLQRALGEVPHDVWLGHTGAEVDRGPASAQEPPAGAPSPVADARPRRPGMWLMAGAAAVAATVALILVLTGDGEDGIDPAVAVHVGPGAAPVSFDHVPGADTARASIRVVRAGPPPRLALTVRPVTDHSGAYEAWLYNSVIDARSLAKLPHAGGTVRFTLPESTSGYRYIDVSEERPGGFPGHSGRSVERIGIPAALGGLGLGGG